MANRGYDAVVDVDADVEASVIQSQRMRSANSLLQADLGHTDLQEDNLEFHQSSECLHTAQARPATIQA
jgi:hypothetical protein